MRKKRKIKIPKDSTKLSYKFVCKCGFELVYHTDMEFILPKQCPMCKQFSFEQPDKQESEDDNIEEYECESEQSA